jgi:hypothetical protein
MTWPSVVNGPEKFSVEAADCIEWFRSMPADSVDLVFGSGPYASARSYGIGFKLSGQPFVDWMVQVFKEAIRVSKGLVGFVIQGQTRKFKWSAEPALLMADLHRAGIALRNPPIFHRVGIAGSGGPDWVRSDYEWIICATKGGRLPWADNTACGVACKYAPGGSMSHRMKNGTRVNGKMVYQIIGSDGYKDGDMTTKKTKYTPPEKANPGNVLHYSVGGGRMGHPLASENEAPMPLGLSEFFVRSFCPPNGIVADPYSGSGTTGHAAIKYGRRFVGCDLRQSQADLSLRRLSNITPCITGP